MSDRNVLISADLPLTLPAPCPICGAKVHLTHVTEWGVDDGRIESIEMECETEPDIESDEWEEWFQRHYHMPYVDWLPYHERAIRWLNKRYRYEWTTTETIP